MEKIIQDQLGSLVFSGLLFFIQLYFRSVLAELKKDISELRADAKDRVLFIYNRLNEQEKKMATLCATCNERHKK
jgi:hypothetical protein